MEIVLYDVVLPKLVCVQINYFLNRIHIVFTHSQKLKLSDHLCTCVHAAQ